MRRVTLVHLRRLAGFTIDHFRALQQDLQAFGFDEVQRYGFVNLEVGDDYLTATLVRRRITYRTIFDPSTGNFSQQEVTNFERTPFGVDAQFGTLDIFASNTKARQLTSLLEGTLDYRLTIEGMGISPAEGLRRIAQQRTAYTLKKLALTEFSALPGIVGRYTPTITDTEQGLALIQDHGGMVKQVTLTANFAEEDNVGVTIAHNGGLSVACNQDHFGEILQSLKRMFFS
ncbi:MAG: hypothetical protein AAF629_36780 [Chloroflexota bacterium]